VFILEWNREGILGVSREIGMTIGKDVDRPNLPLWDRTINQAILRKGGTLRILAGHLHRGDFDPSSWWTKLPVSRPVFGSPVPRLSGVKIARGISPGTGPLHLELTPRAPFPSGQRLSSPRPAHRPVRVYDKLMVFRGSSLTGLTQIQIGNCLVIKRTAVWPSRGRSTRV